MHTMTEEWCNDSKNKKSRETRKLFRAFCALAITTGARPGTELCDMRWSDVKTPRSKFDSTVIRVSGKTLEREVPVEESIVTLDQHLDGARDVNGGAPDTKVFSRSDGVVPHDAMIRLFRRFNVKGLSLYSLRHMFATWLRKHGMKDYQIAELMGTSPAMIFAHYGHVATDEVAKKLKTLVPTRVRRQYRARNQPVEEHPDAIDSFEDGDEISYAPVLNED